MLTAAGASSVAAETVVLKSRDSNVALADQQAPSRGPRAGGPVRGGRRAAPPPEATGENAEVLFERYVRRQARAALQLTPAEMRVLEPRLQQLQVTRRRLQRERQRHLNQLALATRGSAPADAETVRERLEAFESFRVRAEDELRMARDSVDEVLTVEQRARFHVFEQRMERQKLELMARARREAAVPAAPTPTPAEVP